MAFEFNRTAGSSARHSRTGSVSVPLHIPTARGPVTRARSRQHLQQCRALDLAAALVLGFLPWSGCSQGGFYSTGIEGSHGDGCQAIYQPAAAAEARSAASLQQQRQQAAEKPPAVAATAAARTGSSAAVAAVNPTGKAADGTNASSSSNASSTASSSSDRAADNVSPQRQISDTTTDQMQQVPGSVKDLVREILREDNRARTKQLVDDAWQTLE